MGEGLRTTAAAARPLLQSACGQLRKLDGIIYIYIYEYIYMKTGITCRVGEGMGTTAALPLQQPAFGRMRVRQWVSQLGAARMAVDVHKPYAQRAQEMGACVQREGSANWSCAAFKQNPALDQLTPPSPQLRPFTTIKILSTCLKHVTLWQCGADRLLQASCSTAVRRIGALLP